MYRRTTSGACNSVMSAGRAGASATMLNDGRILFAGGISGSAAAGYTSIGSAEIYDPVQNKFTATGNMITARAGHSAVLLNNGDVMMIGGASGSVGGGTTTAELQLAFDYRGQRRDAQFDRDLRSNHRNLRARGHADGNPRCYERDRCAARDRWTDDSADFNADGFAHQQHVRDSHPDGNQHADSYSDAHRNTDRNRNADANRNANRNCYRYPHGERDSYCHAYASAGQADDQADVIEVRHRKGRGLKTSVTVTNPKSSKKKPGVTVQMEGFSGAGSPYSVANGCDAPLGPGAKCTRSK